MATKNLNDVVIAYTNAINNNNRTALEYATNCCFNGNIFYSYHTPIAVYNNEKNVVYVTKEFYSKTTSHQRNVLCDAITTETECSVVMVDNDEFLKML